MGTGCELYLLLFEFPDVGDVEISLLLQNLW